MQSLKGFKTVIFNLIMMVIMAVRLLNPEAELPDDASVDAVAQALDGTIATAWGIGNMLLRAITTSPIFTKE